MEKRMKKDKEMMDEEWGLQLPCIKNESESNGPSFDVKVSFS